MRGHRFGANYTSKKGTHNLGFRACICLKIGVWRYNGVPSYMHKSIAKPRSYCNITQACAEAA
jgi:hypothetical protein